MYSIAQIREDSKQLGELSERIGETFRTRDRGPEQRARWEAACSDFHNRFDKLYYPGGDVELAKVRAGDVGGIESAILFLTADPWHFRSGYIKEYLWRVVTRCPLSTADKERLQSAALSYLDRQIGREFWYMCRAMTRIGSGKFWAKVAQTAETATPFVAKRASYLLAFSHGIHEGAKVQKQVYRDVLREKYG